MQMNSGKIIVFPVFDCILENGLKNILLCLEQSKMKEKKRKENSETHCKVQTHHRNPPIINRKPPSQQTRKPANPQTQQTCKPTITERPSSSPTAPSSIMSSSSTASSGLDLGLLRSQSSPIRARVPPRRPQPQAPPRCPQPRAHRPITSNPSPDLVKKKKKKKPRSTRASLGFLCKRSRAVICCARSVPARGCEERPARGRERKTGSRQGGCARREWLGGSGWLGREQRQRKRKEKGSLASSTRVFGMKTVYGKFFRKPFS